MARVMISVQDVGLPSRTRADLQKRAGIALGARKERAVLLVIDRGQRTVNTMSVRLCMSPSFAIAKKAANRLPETVSPS
jgi:hypothetical protein